MVLSSVLAIVSWLVMFEACLSDRPSIQGTIHVDRNGNSTECYDRCWRTAGLRVHSGGVLWSRFRVGRTVMRVLAAKKQKLEQFWPMWSRDDEMTTTFTRQYGAITLRTRGENCATGTDGQISCTLDGRDTCEDVMVFLLVELRYEKTATVTMEMNGYDDVQDAASGHVMLYPRAFGGREMNPAGENFSIACHTRRGNCTIGMIRVFAIQASTCVEN